MDDNHPQNIDPRPKRRRDKDNPYEIFTVGISTGNPHYYIRFQDGVLTAHCMEISRELFETLNQFELDDLSHMNEVDNHYEHIRLSEAELNARTIIEPESVEAAVCRYIENEKLYAAMNGLPEKQYRRLVWYYFGGLTYAQIAEKEGCNYQAVQESIRSALKKLKKFLK